MRNITKYILTAAVALMGSLSLSAQNNSKANPITVSKNYDEDTQTITLETFVTGYASNITTTTVSDVPLDVVLVLDVSGSMKDNINSTSVSYTGKASQNYSYDNYADNLYYLHSDGKYYKVSRESSKRSNNEYVPLDEASYSYNSYGSSTYYYRHSDGSYYRVYRDNGSASNRRYTLYYRVSGNYYYLTNSGVVTQRPTNISNNNAEIFRGVLYEYTRPSEYRLTVTIGSTKYYLSGSSLTTTAPNSILRSNATIYTGVLYEREETTTSQSKMEALQNAVNQFISAIADKSTSVEHRIAIVKFAGTKTNTVGNQTYRDGWNNYNYSQIVKDLTPATDATLSTTVNSLSAAGATSADYGLEHAQTIINGIPSDRNSSKLVVMFTDGEPNHGSGFSGTVATDAVKAAKAMKDNGVTVYTVGVFDSVSDNINNYMNRVSSNYLTSTTYTNGTKVDSKYYMTATSADELNNVFQTISKDATSSVGGEGYTEATKTNNVTVKDIITPAFVIPTSNGKIDESKIRIWTSSVVENGVHKTTPFDVDNYSYDSIEFGNWVSAADSIKLVPTIGTDGKTTVSVSGFDFSKNWVGLEEVYNNSETPSSSTARGTKLIIEIEIEPNPDYEGGEVTTNDPMSGLYIDGNLVDGELAPVIKYPSTGTFYTDKDLKINLSGLDTSKSETVIFSITRADEDGNPDTEFNAQNLKVAISSDELDKEAIIAKLECVYTSVDADGNKTKAPYKYSVSIDSWDWAYNVTTQPSGPQSLLDENGNIFTFVVAPKTGTIKHDEKKANNVFAE